MSLRAGAADSGSLFEGTMAEAIERGLDAEMVRLTQKKPPPFAKEERRMLFAAIAAGVIDYLRQNQNQLKVVISGQGTVLPNLAARLEIEAPSITVTLGGTPRKAFVSGVYFGASKSVSVQWLGEPAPVASATTDSDGKFTNAMLDPGALSGSQAIVASDSEGRVAFAGVTL
jgi:hypothetical protein